MSVSKVPVEFQGLLKLGDGAIEPAFGNERPGRSDSRKASGLRRLERLCPLPFALGLCSSALQRKISAIHEVSDRIIRFSLYGTQNFPLCSTPISLEVMTQRQSCVRLRQT